MGREGSDEGEGDGRAKVGEVGPSMNSGFGDRVLERTGDLGGWDTVVGEGDV